MTTRTLIFRSLRFHARAHLGALLGAAVGSAVLVGALIVGDSVHGSLREMALQRLGRIQIALQGGDHFFRAQLASDLAHKGLIEGDVVAAIQLPATAHRVDGSARANHIQLLGVDASFWRLDENFSDFNASPTNDEVVLNVPLARQLNASPGETVLIRVAKPSAFSRDAPLTPQSDASLPLRLRVRAIVPDAQLGRFGLHATQVAPFNAFMALATLQQSLKLPDRANLLLAATDESPSATLEANVALKRTWQLADGELEVRELPELSQVELRTSRVFLDPSVAGAASKATTNGQGILTYFVNGLRIGSRDTPYSMVAAVGTPLAPLDMRDDEILINQWLADDLQGLPGDQLTLSYYVIGLSRQLEERTNQFVVRGMLPLTGAAADRSLMPEFPGLENAESTRDWDSSLPIAVERIRRTDEDYWRKYRGTPKAFVTLAAGQQMWKNRFGSLTAMRWTPAPGVSLAELRESLESALRRQIDPAAMGLQFEAVRQSALRAATESQDFGQLFLGFSFFLIGAALILMALLFQFGVEQRASEIGTLLALGFRPKHVRRMLLAEGILLAVFGALIGIFGGAFYAKAMLLGLSTIWQKAVGSSALRYHAEPATLIVGAGASSVVAVIVIWLALRQQARQPARELLAEGAEERAARIEKGGWTRRWSVLICAVSGLAALGIVAFAFAKDRTSDAELFFSAGGLLLIAGWAAAAAVLRCLMMRAVTVPSLGGMAVRNAARRRRRSLAVIALLACGSFLIASIGVFRLDANADAAKRSSGTGGFNYIGESSHPVLYDLNDDNARAHYGLESKVLAGVGFVQMRVHDGDDASCLNLNRAQRPRLLGVRPELLSARKAFTFVKVADGLPKDDPWLLLKRPQTDGAVPAIGDAASIQWALGKKVGDTVAYTDDRGHEFNVRIVGAVANSVLQGSLIIAEDQFVQRFPNENGYRMFLVDGPSNDTIAATLSRALQDAGLELTVATTRLAAFNSVQNTYLNTFQVLGGLGLLLGSVGLGVVVLRNVLERRSELAVLLAVGFRRRAVKWLVVSEHAALLLMGLGVGVVAAFVAVLPALLAPGGKFPYISLAVTLGGVLASGALWTWLAASLALRGRLLDALRNE